VLRTACLQSIHPGCGRHRPCSGAFDLFPVGKDLGKDEQHLTFVKLFGVGVQKLSEELVDTSMRPRTSAAAASLLRELALVVRNRVP